MARSFGERNEWVLDRVRNKIAAVELTKEAACLSRSRYCRAEEEEEEEEEKASLAY